MCVRASACVHVCVLGGVNVQRSSVSPSKLALGPDAALTPCRASRPKRGGFWGAACRAAGRWCPCGVEHSATLAPRCTSGKPSLADNFFGPQGLGVSRHLNVTAHRGCEIRGKVGAAADVMSRDQARRIQDQSIN